METALPYMYIPNLNTIYRRETLVPSIQVYHVMLVVYIVRDLITSHYPCTGITQGAGIANRKITTCNQLKDTDSSYAAEAAFTSETFNSSQSSFPFNRSVNSQYIGCLSVCFGTTVCTWLNLYRQHRSVRGAIPASSLSVSSAAPVPSIARVVDRLNRYLGRALVAAR